MASSVTFLPEQHDAAIDCCGSSGNWTLPHALETANAHRVPGHTGYIDDASRAGDPCPMFDAPRDAFARIAGKAQHDPNRKPLLSSGMSVDMQDQLLADEG